jgi:hypothetical protein
VARDKEEKEPRVNLWGASNVTLSLEITVQYMRNRGPSISQGWCRSEIQLPIKLVVYIYIYFTQGT